MHVLVFSGGYRRILPFMGLCPRWLQSVISLTPLLVVPPGTPLSPEDTRMSHSQKNEREHVSFSNMNWPYNINEKKTRRNKLVTLSDKGVTYCRDSPDARQSFFSFVLGRIRGGPGQST